MGDKTTCRDHTKCPSDYGGWHEWAEKKNKTHRQVKCGECGLYAIWVPRKTRGRKVQDNPLVWLEREDFGRA